jgi:serine/threonine-protein kinase
VIHRDVKPANILLEAGHAVLADFGLAKALAAAGDEGLTRVGFAVGTPAYSSPEQSAGEEMVDGRTDLYSLGCVLYEMLAGQAPFVGPTADSVVRQHMTLEPTSVRLMRPAIPDAAEEIISKAMAKAPADRFQTGEEFVQALDAAVSGEWVAKGPRPRHVVDSGLRRKALLPLGLSVLAVAAVAYWLAFGRQTTPGPEADLLDPSTIAVLYFEDLSPDGAYQHVADGFTEGLISELTRVPELTVVSRNGVASFRGSVAPMDSIARALEVGTLIRGELEPVGEQLRVTVHLVEGNGGSVFDRGNFNVPATDLLVAQDSLVNEAAWLLRGRLGEEVQLRRRQAETSSVEAWALVQRGEGERKQAEEFLTEDDLEGAMAAYDRADSLFTLAERIDAGWIEPVTMRGWVAYRESREATELEVITAAVERALGHADRALDLDPNHASSLELRGTARYWKWLLAVTPDPDEDAALLEGAQEDLETATTIDPTLAGAFSTLSHLYYQTSDLTEALVTARRAYEADLYLTSAEDVLWRLFSTAYDTERFTQARWACGEGRQRFPDASRFLRCQIVEMTLPGGTPDADEAWRLQGEVVAAAHESRRPMEDRIAKIFVAEVLALENMPDSARAVLLAARADSDVDPYEELPFLEAHVRVVLGDFDEAVQLLSILFAGFSEGGGDEADWASHWWWRDLQTNPDFQALVRRSR